MLFENKPAAFGVNYAVGVYAQHVSRYAVFIVSVKPGASQAHRINGEKSVNLTAGCIIGLFTVYKSTALIGYDLSRLHMYLAAGEDNIFTAYGNKRVVG